MNKLISLHNVRKLIDCRAVSTRINAAGKDVPKKKNFENRITLIGTDNSVCITDLKNAQNLSQKKELKLVKIQDVDAKTRRPVYRLMSNAEYHEEEIQNRKEKQEARQNNYIKGEKLLSLSTRIGEHDLMTGVKKMMKLLEKQYEVRVIIAGEGEASVPALEKIYSVIEHNTKAMGKVVQKRNKGKDLRFQLLPLRESSSQSPNSSPNLRDSSSQSPNSTPNLRDSSSQSPNSSPNQEGDKSAL